MTGPYRGGAAGPALYLTFDDRSVGQWYSQRELFLELDARVTFFVSHVDGLSDAEATMLRRLSADGHAVASHGLRHLDAPAFLAEHDADEYASAEIAPSISGLAARGLGRRDFAYPYGRRTTETDTILLQHFSWIRATSPRAADASAHDVLFDPALAHCPRVIAARGIDVGRRGTANPDDSAVVVSLLDGAAESGRSLCLYAHDIAGHDDGMAGGRNFITPERLRSVLEAAVERGVALRAFDDLPD
ncbi:polysaccharide deacetylase family protein [Jiangella endophytica]|uniref:polysaccharide deacetylase family protein n=1 Tax=Jiangella endophytica TaxID=1623398 RepID=UPI000E34DCCA|nr:polysaccharide deacetylase family protein [Jiangella endophytica]